MGEPQETDLCREAQAYRQLSENNVFSVSGEASERLSGLYLWRRLREGMALASSESPRAKVP